MAPGFQAEPIPLPTARMVFSHKRSTRTANLRD